MIQDHVTARAGVKFAPGLRSILRPDHDVILVGEVREADAASTAIEAALTGHMVLTSLHANDSASALTRLMDMGIEPFLLCSSVTCTIAQRLVPPLCPKCKQKHDPHPPTLPKPPTPTNPKYS